MRHGAGKVQCLRLALFSCRASQDTGQLLLMSSTEALELGTLLATALPACAGSLRKLELLFRNVCEHPFPIGHWVAMLGGQLRRLVSGGPRGCRLGRHGSAGCM